jgi:hypothetical protein
VKEAHLLKRRVNMRITLKNRKKQFRGIYEELWNQPRIFIKDLGDQLHMDRGTASKRLKEAIKEGYLLVPQLRKRSYDTFAEYITFYHCSHPFEVYQELSNDINVVYHAEMKGFANLWTISTVKDLDIDAEKVEGGRRSDYSVSYAPNHSWVDGISIMEDMIKAFNGKAYKPQGIIQSRWNETVDWWDKECETLFREFKYNLRIPYTPLETEYHIHPSKIGEFLTKVEEACTVYTEYYPNRLSEYDPYLFMFETDYEDFIIELFSQLPTSVFFFKVSNKLCMRAYIEKSSMRLTGIDMADVTQIHVRLLIQSLLKRGILKSEKDALVEFHCRKNR